MTKKKDISEKKKIGCKGKYEKWISSDGLILVEGYTRDGYTDKELAEKMDISLTTLYEWRNRFPKFADASARNKEIVDIEVETKALNTARGYYVPIMRSYKLKRVEYDPETGKKVKEWEEIVDRMEEQYIPGDPAQQRYWLENRTKGKWTNKQVIEAQGDITVNFNTKVTGNGSSN